MALYFIVKPLTYIKRICVKADGAFGKTVYGFASCALLQTDYVAQLNSVHFYLIFAFIYRLLIVTFVFGWSDGMGYRHGLGDWSRARYDDGVGVWEWSNWVLLNCYMLYVLVFISREWVGLCLYYYDLG